MPVVDADGLQWGCQRGDCCDQLVPEECAAARMRPGADQNLHSGGTIPAMGDLNDVIRTTNHREVLRDCRRAGHLLWAV